MTVRELANVLEDGVFVAVLVGEIYDYKFSGSVENIRTKKSDWVDRKVTMIVLGDAYKAMLVYAE